MLKSYSKQDNGCVDCVYLAVLKARTPQCLLCFFLTIFIPWALEHLKSKGTYMACKTIMMLKYVKCSKAFMPF